MSLRKRCACLMDNNHPFEKDGICLICGRLREDVYPLPKKPVAR